MDCYEEPDWGSIVDAELQETKVKIGQGEDYRPVLEPELLRPVVDGLDVLEEVKAETERESILEREDEIREMHAAALRAQEEREYWNELAKADAEAAKKERERVLAIEKRIEAEAAAAAQRRVREEALLDAVLGWQDAAGEREARLLARSAERAAEEAAKVIDGMDDVVEATQAKNDAIAPSAPRRRRQKSSTAWTTSSRRRRRRTTPSRRARRGGGGKSHRRHGRRRRGDAGEERRHRAERAAEEAAKVIDGMDDVVEATQAK